MLHSITAIAYTGFRPGTGRDYDETKTWNFDEIPRNVRFNDFTISVKEKNDKEVSGSISWYGNGVGIYFGYFCLTPETPEFKSKSECVCYDIYKDITLKAEFSDS